MKPHPPIVIVQVTHGVHGLEVDQPCDLHGDLPVGCQINAAQDGDGSCVRGVLQNGG